MLGLYYGPGACSMAAHIVLEESGEKYEPLRMDLAKGEQRTPERPHHGGHNRSAQRDLTSARGGRGGVFTQGGRWVLSLWWHVRAP